MLCRHTITPSPVRSPTIDCVRSVTKRRVSSIDSFGVFSMGRLGITSDLCSCCVHVATPSNRVRPTHPLTRASLTAKNRPKPSDVIAGATAALQRTDRSRVVAMSETISRLKAGGNWNARVWPWWERPSFRLVPKTTISLSLKVAPYLPFIGKCLTPIGPYGATSAAVSFTSSMLSVKINPPSSSTENTEKCPTCESVVKSILVL